MSQLNDQQLQEVTATARLEGQMEEVVGPELGARVTQ